MIMLYCILFMSIQVCGTDFVTYASVCVLQSQNPNIRVDYEGTIFSTYNLYSDVFQVLALIQ